MASVWSIGDIHGQIHHLEALLEALPRQPGDVTLFIGDYIDRGPDSAGVVRRVLAEHDAAPDDTVLLWGNHEDMAASTFGFDAPSHLEYDPYDWFRNGGLEAMQSYGYAAPELFSAPCPEDLERLFPLLNVYWRPPTDRFPELENCIYVHAGILPGLTPERSSGEVMLWIREDFLDYEDTSGRLVIHGHTPYRNVRVQRDKIGIDTGAAYGGLLTALRLPEMQIYQTDGAGYLESLRLIADE
ncbi:MAG: metallophosphoesterase family protein [Capsulimonadales bacterium]|nr:metallophosphoesterase family protein [Capsulimonadales bacterium]